MNYNARLELFRVDDAETQTFTLWLGEEGWTATDVEYHGIKLADGKTLREVVAGAWAALDGAMAQLETEAPMGQPSERQQLARETAIAIITSKLGGTTGDATALVNAIIEAATPDETSAYAQQVQKEIDMTKTTRRPDGGS